MKRLRRWLYCRLHGHLWPANISVVKNDYGMGCTYVFERTCPLCGKVEYFVSNLLIPGYVPMGIPGRIA